MKTEKHITIALAGQPNTGKSTIFNLLTGSRQHVGNWPGKTVEQKTGSYIHQNQTYHVVDLPGTYSLTANSLEEIIARDYIFKEQPDIVVVVVDAAQLERTMYLLAELLPLPSPVILGLNMMDVAEKEGRRINQKILEQQLAIPVAPMTAVKNKGVAELIETVHRFVCNEEKSSKKIPGLQHSHQPILNQIKKTIEGSVPPIYSEDWTALKLFEGDTAISGLIKKRIPIEKWQELAEILSHNKDGSLKMASTRYAWIQQITDVAVEQTNHNKTKVRRGWFDTIATHPFWGGLLAIVIIVAAFMVAVTASMPLIIVGTTGLPTLISWTREALAGAPQWLVAMIADGLMTGVGMATAFLGFMVGMFLVIGTIEDVGYMARIAFVADRFMSRIGLHGKSFLPMVSSLGCNIAGVLGCRVVDSWQQRMMTLVMVPIVPCSAVWGLVGFIGVLFFGSMMPLIIIMLLLTLVAWLSLTGFLLKRTVVKGKTEGMIMELPPYHIPNWRTILLFTWRNTKSFLIRGFTVVAGASFVIWTLSYFPNHDFNSSFLATAGRFLEPVGGLMGLDWRLMVALLASMVSKEAALATLAVLYGLPSGEGGTSLTGMITSGHGVEQSAVAITLQAAISPASALAFIFAVFFSIPCLGTLGAISSETKSLKWTMGAAAYYLLATFLFGFLAYRIGLVIFH
jgi:ferrous iron transport protein B